MQTLPTDLIDAAWPSSISGNTGSGNYTTFAWVTGVGKGATFTPAKGDTGKKLFVPNAGLRNETPFGGAAGYGTEVRLYSATQRDAANAYAIQFTSSLSSGQIFSNVKQIARPIRCVRS